MDQLVVVKWGGSLAATIEEGSGPAGLAQGLLGLLSHGCRPVLVHGGGPEISRLSRRLGLEARFHQGLRVTDEPTLDAVIMALAGTVSTRLVAALVHAGVPAVGISGVDGGLLWAGPADPDGRLGLVGEVQRVDTALLSALLAAGLLPVVAPLALGPRGLLNVNADLAAAAAAGALEAAHLVFLTDVAGVMAEGQLQRGTTRVSAPWSPALSACRRGAWTPWRPPCRTAGMRSAP